MLGFRSHTPSGHRRQVIDVTSRVAEASKVDNGGIDGAGKERRLLGWEDAAAENEEI